MILSRSKIIRLYHFTKPILSSLNSLQDLESLLQKRLIENIKQVNQSKLNHYQFAQQIAQQLQVNPAQAKQISARTIKLSVIDYKTQRPRNIQVKINQDLKKLKLQPSDFGFPFPQSTITKHHFSQFRGVPTFSQLNQYKFTHKNLYIFNLPDEITEQDIQATLKAKQIKVSFQYCILGLIAYARVQFESQQSLQECLKRFPQKTLQFGDRIAAIKSIEDKKKLKLGNRRVVVNIDQNRSLQQMTLQFSKYGRVVHIDWPVEAWVNPTLEQVKRHYQNSSQLLKINQIFSDGTIESEYFPALKAWQNQADERQQQDLIQKAEKLQESYENRCRFARNLNVYVGRQHEIITGNKGYCVVTYSTFQECQNYYFGTASRDKIQLVADKLDFEYDPSFRRELLRYIDDQFLIGQKKELAQKRQHEKQFSHEIEMAENQKIKSNEQLSYDIAQKIFKKMAYDQSMNRNNQIGFKIFKNQNNLDNSLEEWKSYLNKMKAQKAKSKGQSFDELAQIELYGRVLPKDQQKERLVIQDTTYTPHPYKELVRQNQLITDLKTLYRRKKFYNRQIERNNRMADKARGKVYPQEEEEHKETDPLDEQQKIQAIQQLATSEPIDSGQIGKLNFSTRKPTPLYRKRTPSELAHFKRRFFQFTRNTVFEYMGIFSDKTVEEAADHNLKIINPQSLKWPNGSPFLTEQELPNILQFRRNFETAQQDYNNYILGSQFLKSSGADLQQVFGNFNQLEAQALQHLTDVGVVQEAKKVAGQNLQQKVNVLNSQISDFGQEYRLQEDDNTNTKYLLKVRKLQHLLPIDRVAHLEKFITQHGQDVSKAESEIFSKYYDQIKQKDFIPDQVSEAFGIQKGKRFSDLLAEVGAPHQIFRKDLEMAERAKSYSSEVLKNDLDSQIKLEKTRKKFRRVNSNSFAKDPSQIYVKDRQGYYKVSRFRQI